MDEPLRELARRAAAGDPDAEAALEAARLRAGYVPIQLPPEAFVAGDQPTLSAWLVEPGDLVRAGEPLLELQFDKVAIELEAPADGVLEPVRDSGSEPVQQSVTLGYLAPPDASTQDTKREPGEELTEGRDPAGPTSVDPQ